MNVIVFFADGFEEIEGLATVDVLRRAGVCVRTAAVGAAEGTVIHGAHQIPVICDVKEDDCLKMDVDCVVFPGGMQPGAARLVESPVCLELARRLFNQGKLVAAICAAPIVLKASGCLENGRRYTCYPGIEQRIGGAYMEKERVVVDGNVITACGPGASLEFAFTLVEALCGPNRVAELKHAMVACC